GPRRTGSAGPAAPDGPPARGWGWKSAGPTNARTASCLALSRAQPAADHRADLVDGLGGEDVTVGAQALQVVGQAHLEAEDLQAHVGPGQKGLALARVLGLEQGLQQVVQALLHALAQGKAVVAGKAPGVLARPQDQVVGLGDDG